ncbi:MAG: hypothetical protein KAU46_10345 [Candidatus Aminicenantes bacterium]|nr:hypothetical protein [Candidatus Aminicenantes bacterium]
MIKIDNYHQSGYCRVYLEIEATRPAGIWEEKIGLALAEKSSAKYSIDKNETIYKIENSVHSDKSINDLKQMQKEAQGEFSQKIQTLRKRMDELKLLQKLIKKEEPKNGRKQN